MNYIKLEDVQKILDKYTFHSWIFRDEILSLQSISPESMIEEMIEEIKIVDEDWEENTDKIVRSVLIKCLQELLQRFKS